MYTRMNCNVSLQKVGTRLRLPHISCVCHPRCLCKYVSILSMCCFVKSVLSSLPGGGDSVQELLRGYPDSQSQVPR